MTAMFARQAILAVTQLERLSQTILVLLAKEATAQFGTIQLIVLNVIPLSHVHLAITAHPDLYLLFHVQSEPSETLPEPLTYLIVWMSQEDCMPIRQALIHPLYQRTCAHQVINVELVQHLNSLNHAHLASIKINQVWILVRYVLLENSALELQFIL